MSRLLLQMSILSIAGLHILPSDAKHRVCMTETQYVEYDDSIQICCNGEVSLRTRGQACCGDKTQYFTSLSICCGGNVEARYVPPVESQQLTCSANDEQCRERTCCGGRPVDKDSSMCCQMQTIQLNYTMQLKRDFLQCCGGNIINTLTHFCCGDETFSTSSALSCCDGKKYDKHVEKCLTTYMPNRIVSKYKNICGGIEYDMRNNSCCSGHLQSMAEIDPTLNRNPQFMCCDSIAYDSTKEKCCREFSTGFPTHTIVNDPNIYCCGNGSYNASHQDCYSGRQLEKVSGKVRCGYNYIDGENEKCCADIVYNIKSQHCCTGIHSSVIRKDQECCNGVGTNETTLCCEGITPSVKRRPSDDSCCYNFKSGHSETYNSETNEHCVEGRVIIVPEGATPCGISHYYFPRSQICCDKNVYDIKDGFDRCCLDKPYNSQTQQCCNYVISNISPNDGSCCIKDLKVYRFNDNNNPCSQYCGEEIYDDTQQICCQGIVHNINADAECCGSTTISSFQEGCCGGLFPWSRNGNTRCCGDKDLFNKKHAKCTKNKVIPRDPTVQKLSNTQYLCSRAALKYFDGGVKYACESQNIFKARLTKVKILEKAAPNITYINLSLVDVIGLERGPNFTSWRGPESVELNIEVPKHDDIKCRKNYFTKYCKIIVFFNGKLKDGRIKIIKSSKFFLTSYTKKREVLVTNKLSYEFCKNNFNMH